MKCRKTSFHGKYGLEKQTTLENHSDSLAPSAKNANQLDTTILVFADPASFTSAKNCAALGVASRTQP